MDQTLFFESHKCCDGSHQDDLLMLKGGHANFLRDNTFFLEAAYFPRDFHICQLLLVHKELKGFNTRNRSKPWCTASVLLEPTGVRAEGRRPHHRTCRVMSDSMGFCVQNDLFVHKAGSAFL